MHSPAHSYSSKHSWSPRTSSSGLAVDHPPTRLRKSTTSVLSICIWALGLSVSICVLGQYHLHPSKSTAARSQRSQQKFTTIESAGRMLQELPSLRKQQHSASNDKSGTSSNHAAAQASETTGITGAEKLEPETTQSSVGVVVTLTGCSNFPPDGAAVLQYSVLRQQQKERPNSPYRYQFYAIYHPSARSCAEPLADLNFTLMERESPVLPDEIQGRALRDIIATSGCCGEKELLKFEAFAMTQHDAVVVLDMDAMVTHSLDDAIDLLLHRRVPTDPTLLMYPERPLPEDIWIMYTGDYAMVPPDQELKPAQGGFAILKPNRTIYSDILQIVRAGKFDAKHGWGTDGAYTGWFYGVPTFQGLVPYYFQMLSPGHVVELNWCRFNHMNVQPTWPIEVPGTNTTKETCYTNRDTCEDCRDRTLEEIYSVHFTICQKPWICEPHEVNPQPGDKWRVCHQVHQTWFEWRSEMERSWGRSGRGHAQDEKFVAQFQGYCRGAGGGAYQPIHQPYGRPIDL